MLKAKKLRFCCRLFFRTIATACNGLLFSYRFLLKKERKVQKNKLTVGTQRTSEITMTSYAPLIDEADK